MSPTEKPLILGAGAEANGRGSRVGVEKQVSALEAAGLRVEGLEIDSLQVEWKGRPDGGGSTFQSGCAPILALARARELLGDGAAEAVVIRGDEPLATGYAPRQRRRLMRVYGDTSIPEAYTSLARLQMQRMGLSETAYRRLADGLLDNYARTAGRRGLRPPSEHGDRAATSLFRFADCANPNVDFRGSVLLGSPRAAEVLGLDVASLPRVLGVCVELREDGPDHVAELVGYAHLQQAYARACAEASLDFAARFVAGEALLEAYTCFPPVPLGLLLATGLAAQPEELEPLLARHEITVTGGMNLAGAPWNNAAMQGLVLLWEQLSSRNATDARVGLLHGNGGVGGYQGVAIIGVGEA